MEPAYLPSTDPALIRSIASRADDLQPGLEAMTVSGGSAIAGMYLIITDGDEDRTADQ